jgi:hypothetical protein
MSYLLDTNIISETTRQEPNRELMEWLEEIPHDSLYISVLTIGEIRKGIERLDSGKRRERLRIWLEHNLFEWFGDRVISINYSVADRWGKLIAQMGRSVPTIDSLLAATALHYELRLVTRNEKDFEYPGLEVINPWALDS